MAGFGVFKKVITVVMHTKCIENRKQNEGSKLRVTEYLNYKDSLRDSVAGYWPSKHKVLSSSLSTAQRKTIPDLSIAIRRGENLPITEECERAVSMGGEKVVLVEEHA